MQNLGMTQSVCGKCLKVVPAKIVADSENVYFQKFCPEHGSSKETIYTDVAQYLQTQRFVKPAWVPLEFSGKDDKPCPQGCGFCSRHEQHLCMPIIEITSRCDLECPVCIVDAGQGWDMRADELDTILDGLIRAEKQIDVLNISGGEPLVHPRILELLDNALSRPEIIRASISTNGLTLLKNRSLLPELKNRNVVIALQFDGFSDNVYEILRGRKLLDQKLAILEMLADAGITTSLTFTAAGNINTDPLEFKRVLDLLFATPNIVSLMIQPLSFAGRGARLAGRAKKISIPDITKMLDGAGVKWIRASDFAPLPCSHPLCFSLAYYLMVDGSDPVSLNQLVDASQIMGLLANRTIFGLDDQEQEKLKDMIYQIWSGPVGVVPDSQAVMNTLRRMLESVSSIKSNPRQVFALAERSIKSIFIHAFQDAACFDLSRVRRCCNGYPQPDGRIIPACVHNVLGRRTASIWSDLCS